MKKLLAAAAVGALATVAFATPAFATGNGGKDKVDELRRKSPENICTVPNLNYNNTKNLVLSDGATAETDEKGLKLTTPVREDHKAKLHWKVSLGTPVLLSKFVNGGMLLTKLDKAGPGVNDAALLSYDIYVDKDGNGTNDFTMVYEPYWQGSNPARNTPKLWVVDGSSKVWGTPLDAWPGNVNAEATKTIDQVKALYPNAKITGYGYHQGTWNDGTISLLSAFWFDTNDSVKEAYAWSSYCNTQKVEFKDTCTGTSVTMSNSTAYLTTKFKIGETVYEVGEAKTVVVEGAKVEVKYGYKFNKTSDHTWVKPNNCASPSPSTSVIAQPSTSGSTGGTPAGQLPVTGSRTWVMVGAATLIGAIGVGILFITRKREDDKVKFVA